MAYTKQTWQNEVLSGVSADQALFTIENSEGNGLVGKEPKIHTDSTFWDNTDYPLGISIHTVNNPGGSTGNAPSYKLYGNSDSAYFVTIMKSNLYTIQIAYVYNTNPYRNHTFTRDYRNGTWSDWCDLSV